MISKKNVTFYDYMGLTTLNTKKKKHLFSDYPWKIIVKKRKLAYICKK